MNLKWQFIEAGEGRIEIKGVSLKKITNNSKIFSSDLAQHVFNELDLSLDTESEYDEGIRKIIKYTSDLILARKRKDTLNISRTKALTPYKEQLPALNKYLQLEDQKVTKSYDKTLVYAAIELLEAFNIGTRRVEINKKKKRIHTAMMYYNPFSKQWITVDPFYNSKISKKEKLSVVTKEDILSSEYGGLSDNTEGLISKYKNSKIIVKKEKSLGHPF